VYHLYVFLLAKACSHFDPSAVDLFFKSRDQHRQPA